MLSKWAFKCTIHFRCEVRFSFITYFYIHKVSHNRKGHVCFNSTHVSPLSAPVYVHVFDHMVLSNKEAKVVKAQRGMVQMWVMLETTTGILSHCPS